MKYRLIITFIMFMVAVYVTEAQSFRDDNNMRLSTISSDGTIRNNNNMRIGIANGINAKDTVVLFFFNIL